MRHLAIALCATLASCMHTAPALAAPTFPDRGRAAVADFADVIPDRQEAALNARIISWVQATGHQLAVVTVPSLQGHDIKDYGYQLGRAWGLGSKHGNDGVILLLAPKERKVRIEVGYGLEAVLTDGKTSQIIRNRIVPGLKSGATASAMINGADAIMVAATVEAPAAAHMKEPGGKSLFWPWVLAGIIIGLIALAVLRVRIRARLAEHRERTFQRDGERRRPDTTRNYAVQGKAPAERPVQSTLVRRPSATRPAPRMTPKPTPAPAASYRDDDFISSASSFGAGCGLGSSSSSSDSGSSCGGSDSSSSGGFDSGGGSFGGGGSDSSY